MAPDVSGAVAPAPVEPARFVSLPEPFLHALFGRLSTEDAKALRVTCSRAQAACASACRLPRLRATALLSEPPPPLSHLPPTIDLDFNARNADCGHRLLSALRQQSGRLGRRVRGVRLSGRDGLLSALQTLRLACPGLERLEIRCQHGYKGRHAECSDLGRCLQELECAFTGLKELHLTRLPISGPQLCGLCDSLGPGLRALSVRGLRHALTCESLSHLGRLGQLESLCVDHLRLQTRGFPAGPPLRSLELSDATVSAAGFASLNALTGLTRLALWGSGHRAALAFAPLPGLTALRRLHLEMALGDEVVAGLAECPALVVLSAQTARVSPRRGPALGHTVVAEGGGGAAAAVCAGVVAASAGDADADAEQAGGSEGLGLSVAAAAAGVLPLALTAVTRLCLESWEEGCAPLAAWLPGLRALTLEEGEGAWAAVAGHTALTALRMDAGGCLPPPEPGSAAAEAAAAELAAAGPEHGDGVEGKEEEGDEIAPLPIGHHHAHHHHHQGHSHYHRIRGADGSDGGGGGGSDSDDEASVGGGGGSTASVSVSGTATDGTRSGCSTDSGAVAANGFANGGGGPSFRQRHSHTGGADGDGGAGDGGGSEEEAWWPPPPQLASLRLGGCEGWPEQAYGRCAPLPALTGLDLAGCQGLTAAALRRLLAAAPALRELALAGAPHLTDEALASLGGGVSACVSGGGGNAGGDCGAGSSGNAGGLDTGDGAVAGMEEEEGVVEAEAEAGAEVALGVCAPAVAAAARGGRAATGVPVPPCAACADVAEAAVTCSISTSLADLALCTTTTTTTTSITHANGEVGDVTHGPGTNGSSPNGANVCAGRAMPRSTSAAALAAAAAAPWACAQEPADAAAAATAALAAGAAAGLRRLELSRAPLITARGVAAAAAGLPDLTELRLDACQGVCREACVWLPQQLGRPSLSVVCAHDAVYDEH